MKLVDLVPLEEIDMNELVNEVNYPTPEIELRRLGIRYTLSGDKNKPIDKVFKPIDKSDDFYRKFDDVIDRYGLSNSVVIQNNEGTCGHGPNGVPGKTPGGTRGMPADDRTRDMLKMLIQREVAKLDEEDVNPKIKAISSNINKAIISLDPEMSYVDFAKGVAQVLIDEYGTHNYEPFVRELKKALDSTLG